MGRENSRSGKSGSGNTLGEHLAAKGQSIFRGISPNLKSAFSEFQKPKPTLKESNQADVDPTFESIIGKIDRPQNLGPRGSAIPRRAYDKPNSVYNPTSAGKKGGGPSKGAVSIGSSRPLASPSRMSVPTKLPKKSQTGSKKELLFEWAEPGTTPVHVNPKKVHVISKKIAISTPAPVMRRIVRLERPTSAPSDEREAIEGYLEIGTKAQFRNAIPGTPIDVQIGLDLGTSSTKIVLRTPLYQSGRAVVLLVPNFIRAEGNSRLWQTVVWLGPLGQFSLYPAARYVPLEGIKTSLMEPNAVRDIIHSDPGGYGVTAAQAGVGLLALLIRVARGWFIRTQARRFTRQQIRWAINVGFPAATYDDKAMLRTYRLVASAAWSLANSSDGVDLQTVTHHLGQSESDQLSKLRRSRREVEIIPEVAAEVASFVKSTNRRDGLFAMIDVGATTLDISTFRIRITENYTDRMPILMADVQQLGTEALRWCLEEGGTEDEFFAKAMLAIRILIWQTKMRRDPNALNKWRDELPIFFCGGGSNHPKFKRVLQEIDTWLKKYIPNGRGAHIGSLVVPQELGEQDGENHDFDFNRLAVAWGLSYPAIDISEVVTPSEIEDIEKWAIYGRRGFEFVSKDQV